MTFRPAGCALSFSSLIHSFIPSWFLRQPTAIPAHLVSSARDHKWKREKRKRRSHSDICGKEIWLTEQSTEWNWAFLLLLPRSFSPTFPSEKYSVTSNVYVTENIFSFFHRSPALSILLYCSRQLDVLKFLWVFASCGGRVRKKSNSIYRTFIPDACRLHCRPGGSQQAGDRRKLFHLSLCFFIRQKLKTFKVRGTDEKRKQKKHFQRETIQI